MDDFSRVLFQNAVIKEQISQKMYINLGNKTNNEIIKKLFYKIAEEEMLHEQLFSKMDTSILKKVNEGFLKDLHLLNAKQSDLLTNDTKEINKAIDFAIDEEQKAYEDYYKLLVHLDFGEARETLKEIAQQELQHRTMLQKIKIEFNNKDW
jgi:rubrerythrin